MAKPDEGMTAQAHAPPSHLETSMSRNTWALLLFLSVLWGCSFPFVKIAIVSVPPLTLVFARVFIAALALGLVIALSANAFPLDRKTWRPFFIMALLNSVIPMSAFFWAQQFVPSGLGAILNATTPLFAAVICHFLLPDERITPLKLAGVMIGFAGVAALIGPHLLFEHDGTAIPQLAFIFTAFCYACSTVYGRRFSALGLTPVQTAFGQLAAAALLMAPLAAMVERPWLLAPPDMKAMMAVLGLALLSTSLAFMIFFRILARAGAANVTLVTLLVPVTAIIIGAVALNERLEPHRLFGMVIIAAGLILINGRAPRALRHAFAR